MATNPDGPLWFECPECKGRGNVDREQYEGKVSIICVNCGWHGYRK